VTFPISERPCRLLEKPEAKNTEIPSIFPLPFRYTRTWNSSGIPKRLAEKFNSRGISPPFPNFVAAPSSPRGNRNSSRIHDRDDWARVPIAATPQTTTTTAEEEAEEEEENVRNLRRRRGYWSWRWCILSGWGIRLRT